MAKFSGKIGFADTIEVAPGVWQEQITERKYVGDITRSMRKLENGDNVNDNIRISNTISIVADPFANANIFAMRYVVWQGAKWKVTDVDVQRPRLTLTIGGLYNDGETGSAGGA